jgi:hypothetical protein
MLASAEDATLINLAHFTDARELLHDINAAFAVHSTLGRL